MDWGFTAFAVGSTLSLAGGGLLLLIGYIGTLPAAFSFGWKTGLPVLLFPVVGPVWFALKRGPERQNEGRNTQEEPENRARDQ